MDVYNETVQLFIMYVNIFLVIFFKNNSRNNEHNVNMALYKCCILLLLCLFLTF